MIRRRSTRAGTISTASYSDDLLYRYALTRTWDPAAPRLLYIMLNPSTATEQANDPTVERCERRARAMGYGAFRVANIFALRATDPRDMRAHPDPIGPANQGSLLRSCGWTDDVICAWGTHGAHRDQGPRIETLLRKRGVATHHFGLTQGGHPRHPLYVAYAQGPLRWF